MPTRSTPLAHRLLFLQEEVTLETAAVQNATAEVMAVHAIPSFASKDILEALKTEGLLEEPSAA